MTWSNIIHNLGLIKRGKATPEDKLRVLDKLKKKFKSKLDKISLKDYGA